MPVATITKTFTFEAAHQLPDHGGKCSNPHGHSYRAEISLRGEVQEADGRSEGGMVLDFAHVRSVWRDVCDPFLDHQDLNEAIGPTSRVTPKCWPTTAENLAAWIFARMSIDDSINARLVSVTVWETSTSSATIDRESGVAW